MLSTASPRGQGAARERRRLLEHRPGEQLADVAQVELAENSNRTLPSPLNHSSSSESLSKWPADSIDQAWMFEYGSDEKSFFLPDMPCTFTAISGYVAELLRALLTI
ncbi:hypothetical protein GCM10028798_05670 [Humibacter antri]